MNQHHQNDLGKYFWIIAGVIIGGSLTMGAIAAFTGKGSGAISLMIPAWAIWMAMSKFATDNGRLPDDDEIGSLTKCGLWVTGALALLGIVALKIDYDASPLHRMRHETMGFGMVLAIFTVAMLFNWLSLRIGVWMGRKIVVRAQNHRPTARPAGGATTAAAAAMAPTLPAMRKLRILVIGNGGREHALAWKLAQSSRTLEVLVAPGNAGTAGENKVRNVDVDLTKVGALLDLARREKVDLTVVGPEGPLVLGVVDAFKAAGLRIFGPTAAAAQLEGSKAFAKAFMQRHGIPTAAHAVFDDLDEAVSYVRKRGAPIVIKADGLAAGKGVVVATTLAEAEAALTALLGSSGLSLVGHGPRVVVEDFLDGEEASFIVMADGRSFVPMATSQDHKRIGDGDTGPNTGGMGAISPAPVVTDAVHARVVRDIIEPTLRGLASDGMPFTGFLYAGLMIDRDGAPRVIEFNVRFGDPETQPILMRLQTDLVDLLEAGVDQHIAQVPVRWNRRPALAVVMAAAGYPDAPRTGDEITGLPQRTAMDVKVFHAATRADGARTLTAGGRVLTVCALGETFAEAQMVAYETVGGIAWAGEQHRRDIGWRALAHKAATAEVTA